MLTRRLRQLMFALGAVAILTAPAVSYAQIVPSCNPIPGQNNSCTINDLLSIPVRIYNLLLGLAAVVAMLMLIIGGVQYVLAFTGGDKAAEAAKARITHALIGLAIVLVAFLAVNTLLYTILGLNPNGAVATILHSFG